MKWTKSELENLNVLMLKLITRVKKYISSYIKKWKKIDNSSFPRVEEFKYLGKTLTNQNSIHEETKSKFKSGNACSHSVQNLSSSSLLL